MTIGWRHSGRFGLRYRKFILSEKPVQVFECHLAFFHNIKIYQGETFPKILDLLQRETVIWPTEHDHRVRRYFLNSGRIAVSQIKVP